MSQNIGEIVKICLLVIILTISAGMFGAIFSESQASRAGETENWNLKEVSISPESPTANDFITFTLEVNTDDNITKVQIFICKNNICGVPKQLTNSGDNTYTYKHSEKFDTGTKVDYRFMVTYDNITDPEKIPYSSKTESVAEVQGSLYFEFFMGENWNFNTASIDPQSPKDTDPVTFTLIVNDDVNIEKVLITISQIKPLYLPELPVEMTKSSDNTYTYERTTAFDPEAQIGYLFHIKYNGEDALEAVPINADTANTVSEEDVLYFAFTVQKTTGPDDNGDTDPDDKDDENELPLILILGVIIAVVVVVILIFVAKGKKK
jgi:flagellar basal body-associated protein FliL